MADWIESKSVMSALYKPCFNQWFDYILR